MYMLKPQYISLQEVTKHLCVISWKMPEKSNPPLHVRSAAVLSYVRRL